MWLLWALVIATMLGFHPRPASAESIVVEVSPDGVQRAEIIVDSYAFKPDHFIVMVNTPVELTLKRVSRMVPHNFVIEEKEAGMEIHKEVPFGKSITVRFTPTRAAKYKFFCDKKLLFLKSHEARGMVGTLEVREATP
ncbi:MAG: cupredoxin domain-containing protein [Nitrospira sp.]|nr:cupredoxin domain-containing protein [Nitrospira sp.]